MTFSSKETSEIQSAPVELYEFKRGLDSYNYTSSDADIVYTAISYESIAMERDEIELSGEMGRNSLKIEVPRDLEFLAAYLASPPSDITTVLIKRNHRTEPETSAVVIWSGRLLNVEWKINTAILVCEPVYTSLRRPGLRKRHARGCIHALYGKACRVAEATFRYDTTVQSLNNTEVVFANLLSFPSGYFAGGSLEYEYNGIQEKRMILRHDANTVFLSATPVGLNGAQDIKLLPGCDHTLSTCKNKFNNILNYGGEPYLPPKSPFGGTPLW